MPKKVYLQGILQHYFIQKNLQLKLIEFFLRLTVTMPCWKQHAEIGLNTSKIMIFILKIKNVWRIKKFKDKELEALFDENSCQSQVELTESLEVDDTTVSKCLKALGMIQKQGYWVLYELKPRDVKPGLIMCEQLLQQQKRKGF